MRTLILCFILTLSSLAIYGQNNFQEGTHYEVVADQKTVQPTVTEFFSLYCGHCFSFESLVDTVKASLAKGTTFEKSHVDYIPRDDREMQFAIVKAFVAMQDLGMEKQLSSQFFAAIHMEGIKIDSVDDIKQIFLANDISSAKFDKLFNDPSLVQRAKVMSKLWIEKKITNVPTLVVNGKYKVTMTSVKSLDELISLTNFLLEK